LGGGTFYHIPKLLFTEGQGQAREILEEAMAHIELVLPCRLIISKKMDGVNMELAQLDQPMVTNPLEKFLSAYQFGTYDQSQQNKEFTFMHIEDLWQEEIGRVDSSDQELDTGKTMISTPTETRATTQPHTNQSTTVSPTGGHSTTNTNYGG
jgi:hypothetical protein